MTGTKKIIILVISGIAVLCVWLFFSARSVANDPLFETFEYYQPFPTPGNDLEMIEADSEIQILSSAREIHAAISGFRELDTWVRFELPSDQFESFLEKTLCKLPITQVDPQNYVRHELDPAWWTPNTSTTLLECRGTDSDIRQHILIDQTNSQKFIIYVFSSTYHVVSTATP